MDMIDQPLWKMWWDQENYGHAHHIFRNCVMSRKERGQNQAKKQKSWETSQLS